MWRNDKNSILIIDGSKSKLAKAKEICEEASIICYTTRSSLEAIDILINNQIDGVLVFTGLGHSIELIRTFSTVACTFVLCKTYAAPGGTDNIINEYDFKMEDIPKYLKKMFNDSTQKTKFKGSVWFNRLRLDMDNYAVTYNDETIKMKPLEIKLLYYLLKHVNRVVSRKRLLSNVWNYEQGGETRTLDVHIMALRAIIEKYEIPLSIETLRGKGYKLFDKASRGGAAYFELT